MTTQTTMTEEPTMTIGEEFAAAELLELHRRLSAHARAHYEAGFRQSAELATEAAGVIADAFQALTGRHPGEVDL
jgi:hypothetical protein